MARTAQSHTNAALRRTYSKALDALNFAPQDVMSVNGKDVLMRTYRVDTMCGVIVTVRQYMNLNGRPFTVEPLTFCCGAAITGQVVTEECPTGISCKGCGKTYPREWGSGNRACIYSAVQMAGCPDPEGCTDHTMWTVDSLLQDDED